MSYQRPILASAFYGLAILAVVATVAAAAVAAGGSDRSEKFLTIPFVLGYGFAVVVVTAGTGQIYDLLGRIEYNTRITREEAEERMAERAKVSGEADSSVKYIPGING